MPALEIDDLKKLIIESLDLQGMTPETLDTDARLFGEGLGLDSVDALELVVALEQRLGVKIDNEMITPEAFASVGQIHRFIEEQWLQAEGGA